MNAELSVYEDIGSSTEAIPEPTRKFEEFRDLKEERVYSIIENRQLETVSTSDPCNIYSPTTVSSKQPKASILPFPKVSSGLANIPTFISLQKWEGTILEIYEETFLARLRDLTQDNIIEEEAEFFLSDVSDDDNELLAEGAIFYWHIGYSDSPQGQRKRESYLRFRRLPAWSKKEIEKAEMEAEIIGKKLGWK